MEDASIRYKTVQAMENTPASHPTLNGPGRTAMTPVVSAVSQVLFCSNEWAMKCVSP